MTNKTKIDNGENTPNLAKKLLIRGLIAIIGSGIIALLISTGIGEPYPNLKFAYIGCAAVGTWGLFDIIRSIFEFRNSK